MLFVIRRKNKSLRNKLNLRSNLSYAFTKSCNFTIGIETKIDGITSYVNSKCSSIRKNIVRNFKRIFATIQMKKFSDINFIQKFTAIDADKSVESNYESLTNTINVSKVTVIT